MESKPWRARAEPTRRTRRPTVPALARARFLALTPETLREQIDGDLGEGFRRPCEAFVVAVVFALTGIDAVVELAVGDRKREIGVRLAPGVWGPSIANMILLHGATLASIGVGIGLTGGIGPTRFLHRPERIAPRGSGYAVGGSH